jgi:hypothetical protein
MDDKEDFTKSRARGLTTKDARPSDKMKKKNQEKEVRTLTFVDMGNLSYLARSVTQNNNLQRVTNLIPGV